MRYRPLPVSLFKSIDISAKSNGRRALAILSPKNVIGFPVRRITLDLDSVVGNDVLMPRLVLRMPPKGPVNKLPSNPFCYAMVIEGIRMIGG
jgi:hypothetical protein